MGEGLCTTGGDASKVAHTKFDQPRCSKGKQWEKALALLEEMPSKWLTPDVISLSAAISACGEGKQWEKALALLEEMPSKWLTPDLISLNSSISACGEGKQWQKALALLEEIPAK